MFDKPCKKSVASAVGVAMAGSLMLAGSAGAAENPFGMADLNGGYMQTAAAHAEGKCGGNMKSERPMEGKCGTGKCGANMMKSSKPMEGKCGGNMKSEKPMEGKCGTGKCGANMMKSSKPMEGKCGGNMKSEKPMEGKCGSNK